MLVFASISLHERKTGEGERELKLKVELELELDKAIAIKLCSKVLVLQPQRPVIVSASWEHHYCTMDGYVIPRLCCDGL